MIAPISINLLRAERINSSAGGAISSLITDIIFLTVFT